MAITTRLRDMIECVAVLCFACPPGCAEEPEAPAEPPAGLPGFCDPRDDAAADGAEDGGVAQAEVRGWGGSRVGKCGQCERLSFHTFALVCGFRAAGDEYPEADEDGEGGAQPMQRRRQEAGTAAVQDTVAILREMLGAEVSDSDGEEEDEGEEEESGGEEEEGEEDSDGEGEEEDDELPTWAIRDDSDEEDGDEAEESSEELQADS